MSGTVAVWIFVGILVLLLAFGFWVVSDRSSKEIEEELEEDDEDTREWRDDAP